MGSLQCPAAALYGGSTVGKMNQALLFGLGLTLSLSAAAGPREQAKRIHDRLTGVPPSNAMLDAMEDAISGGGGAITAALYAIDGAPSAPATASRRAC